MKKFGIAILLIVLVGLAIWIAYPIYWWNQKLTVEVETPDGVRTGSSVVGVTVSYGPTFGLPEASRSSKGWRGEAVIVALPGKRYLFMLLGNPVSMARQSFRAVVLGRADARFKDLKAFYSKLKKLRATVPLIRKKYPLLVTFADLKDPKSVKKVDPDDLAATFGPGYRLKSATLEITDEPVTKGRVEKLLGWLKGLKGGYLHGGFTSKGAPLGLHGGAFKVGDQ